MYQNKERRCKDRIVSVSQPHVRPIVLGKIGKSTEFGAKISVSMTADGFAFVDRIGWDAFNESADLKRQVERYKDRLGYLPEIVLADQLYSTRDNRRFLKELGVRQRRQKQRGLGSKRPYKGFFLSKFNNTLYKFSLRRLKRNSVSFK